MSIRRRPPRLSAKSHPSHMRSPDLSVTGLEGDAPDLGAADLGDEIIAAALFCCRGVCLFSDGLANSGGVQSGFFGPNAEEVVGTYQFQIGRTRAAGAFGATLQ